MTTSPGECVALVTVAIRNILLVSTSTLYKQGKKGREWDSGEIVGSREKRGESADRVGIVGKKGERVGREWG